MLDPVIWLIIGFTGQALFTARFLVQWLVSEKKRDSVVPVAFWWLSLLGGLTLLTYACYRQDPVIIVGQGMGLFVYTRNLMLIGRRSRRGRRRRREVEPPVPTFETADCQTNPPHVPNRPHRIDTSAPDRSTVLR